MVTTSIVVGMAEIHVVKGNGTLCCLGLGSCIGLAVLDPIAQVGGMVHVMLPEPFAGKPIDQPGKFAKTGVIALLEEMQKLGANKSRLICAMAGGAQVFNFGNNAGKLDIGSRNIAEVENQLRSLNHKVRASDVGGNLGRTVTFVVETGEVRVKTVSQGERPLCNLRSAA